MENLKQIVLEEDTRESSSDLRVIVSNQTTQDALHAKRIALMQKCDSLSEALWICERTYIEILSTLADVNQESLERLQVQIFALKENIPHLERKWIKRLRMKGTLTTLHKATQKMKLKPKLARTKDLSKIDDFLLRSYRALSFINDRAQRTRGSELGKKGL